MNAKHKIIIFILSSLVFQFSENTNTTEIITLNSVDHFEAASLSEKEILKACTDFKATSRNELHTGGPVEEESLESILEEMKLLPPHPLEQPWEEVMASRIDSIPNDNYTETFLCPVDDSYISDIASPKNTDHTYILNISTPKKQLEKIKEINKGLREEALKIKNAEVDVNKKAKLLNTFIDDFNNEKIKFGEQKKDYNDKAKNFNEKTGKYNEKIKKLSDWQKSVITIAFSQASKKLQEREEQLLDNLKNLVTEKLKAIDEYQAMRAEQIQNEINEKKESAIKEIQQEHSELKKLQSKPMPVKVVTKTIEKIKYVPEKQKNKLEKRKKQSSNINLSEELRNAFADLRDQYWNSIGVASYKDHELIARIVVRAEAIDSFIEHPNRITSLKCNLSTNLQEQLEKEGIDTSYYSNIVGNSIYTQVTKECVDFLEETAKNVTFMNSLNITTFSVASMSSFAHASQISAEFNKFFRSFEINDFCFAMIDCAKIIYPDVAAFNEGIISGKKNMVDKIIHPKETVQNIASGIATVCRCGYKLLTKYLEPELFLNLLNNQKDITDFVNDDVGFVYHALKSKCSSMTSQDFFKGLGQESTEVLVTYGIASGFKSLWKLGKIEIANSGIKGLKASSLFKNPDRLLGLPNGSIVLDISESVAKTTKKAKTLTSVIPVASAWQSTANFMIADKASRLSNNGPQQQKKGSKKQKAKNILDATPTDKLKEKFVPLEEELAQLEETIGGKLIGHEELGCKEVTINFKHIFEPDANKYGAPTGFHHNLNGHWNKTYNITKTKELKHGCYIAEWTKNVNVKLKTSSFFPDSMSRIEVVKSIKEAYYNLIEPISSRKKMIIGTAKNGIVIGMEINKTGLIKTAYPFIEEMIL